MAKGSIAVKLKTITTALAALSLGVAPTLAAAQPIATPLTQTAQPASETVDGDSALRGRGGSGIFIAAIAIILIGIAIYIAVDKDDSPNSP